MPRILQQADLTFHFILQASVLYLGVLLSAAAFAQPDLSITANMRLLHDAPAGYVFETFDISSPTKKKADEQRYRIYLGIPRKAPPPEGYPAFYALDGNAVLDALSAQKPLLEKIAASASPPLLVLIGYETQSRFDVVARAYDYTPQIPNKATLEDLPGSGRKAGGADVFLDFIETRLKPELRKKLPLNPLRQTLWGHSYGGLFVLHTLFTHKEYFQHYIAVSPSLWWQKGWILREAETFATRTPPQTLSKLLIMSGTNETPKPKVQPARNPQRDAIPKDSLPKLIEHLNTQNKRSARLILLEGKTHGEMFPLGLESALRLFAEETP